MSSGRKIRTPQLDFTAVWPTVKSSSDTSVEVKVNEVSLRLLPQQLAVLKRLFRNSGKVVPNVELGRELNQGESIQGIISELRKKLASIRPVTIDHVVGSGYAIKGVVSLSEPLL